MSSQRVLLKLDGSSPSVAELTSILASKGVKTPDSEIEDLLMEVTKDRITGTFQNEVRYPKDFGYCDEKQLPTLHDIYQAAESRGLQRGTPALAYALFIQDTPVLAIGTSCTVSMDPITVSSERCPFYLPQLQTICRADGRSQVIVRMVGSNLSLKVSLRQSIMFFRRLTA